MKKKWEIDIAVLIIFFVRSETLEKVFESVKAVRPRTLLLWQDGPREGRHDDIKGIQKCRDVVSQIDWDCEVHYKFHEKNMGCDPSTFYAQKWAFSIVDKCIVLEDDQVPSKSYYYYCKELLDYYENDERISHINGHNFLGEAEWCPYDYLFAKNGTGAWASWKRVADTWDEQYSFLDKNYEIDNLVCQYGRKSKQWVKTAEMHKRKGVPYWESVIGMSAAMGSRFAIIPKVNMVQNIGITENATHSGVDDLRILPHTTRKMFEVIGEEMNFPIHHPSFVLLDYKYEKKMQKMLAPNIFQQIGTKVELLFNMIRYKKLRLILSLLKKKVQRVFGKGK